jgi:diacylglycerol kinase (ATP)
LTAPPEFRKERLPALRARARSFAFAFRGLAEMLRTQHNTWIHAAVTAGVFAAAFLLRVSPLEWAALALACMAVWIAEALNTALEFLADAAVPEFHAGVGRAKDVAAAAVLIASLGATAVGLFVFVPRLLGLAGPR